MEPAETDIGPRWCKIESGFDAVEICGQAGEAHDEMAVDHIFIGDLEAVARVARIGVGGEFVEVADAVAVAVGDGKWRCVSSPPILYPMAVVRGRVSAKTLLIKG